MMCFSLNKPMNYKLMKRINKSFSILTVALIITVFGVVSISAQANYMTSFGLKLGAPFNVPECPIVQQTYVTGKRYENYATSKIESMCFQRDLTPYFKKGLLKDSIKKPLPPLFSNGKVNLIVPIESSPDYIAGGATAFLIDGNFVGIEFYATGSFKTPNTALVSALTEKYGNPTKVTPIELQNDYGAKYTAYTYEWQLSSLSVFYDGYKGTVSIETSPLIQLRRELRQKEDETKKKTRILL